MTYVSDPESEWAEWNEPGEAQIRLLAVDTAVQGRGIGEALVTACIERAREQGLTILLHTTQSHAGRAAALPAPGLHAAPNATCTTSRPSTT